MEQSLSRNSLTERKQTLLEILNYIGNMDDENQLTNILYIAQTFGHIDKLYNFRIENAYLPYSRELHSDIAELVDDGYLKKSSLILVKKREGEAKREIATSKINVIRRIKRIKQKSLIALTQLTYLNVQKNIPEQELFRISPTIATQGLRRTKNLLRKLNSLRIR